MSRYGKDAFSFLSACIFRSHCTSFITMYWRWKAEKGKENAQEENP